MMDASVDFSKEMEALTKDLVGIRSVNGTAGEREVAEFILRWLRSFPYFAAHPERAFTQEIPGDRLGRENVFAYVHGTKKAGTGPRRTLVWHGHIDTVGTEDFGALESVKAASDLISPVSGEVVEVNEALEDEPELINQDAYENWIIKVRMSDKAELDALMDAAAYKNMTE